MNRPTRLVAASVVGLAIALGACERQSAEQDPPREEAAAGVPVEPEPAPFAEASGAARVGAAEPAPGPRSHSSCREERDHSGHGERNEQDEDGRPGPRFLATDSAHPKAYEHPRPKPEEIYTTQHPKQISLFQKKREAAE